jgi:FkbM family methyltransferase
VTKTLFEMGNLLYKTAPALYRRAYRLYKHSSDRAEFRLLRGYVLQGMRVADVGANIGIYSSELARLVGSEGHVFAFEPDARNFQLLLGETACRSNVTPVNAAVGPTSGEVTLYLSETLNVDHHTYDDGTGRANTVVPVVALDDYFKGSVTPDFIKMDIQGYELQAMKGFQRMMRGKMPPKLFFEYWPYGIRQAGDTPKEVFELLSNCGYRWRAIREADRAVLEGAETCSDPDLYINILAYR